MADDSTEALLLDDSSSWRSDDNADLSDDDDDEDEEGEYGHTMLGVDCDDFFDDLFYSQSSHARLARIRQLTNVGAVRSSDLKQYAHNLRTSVNMRLSALGIPVPSQQPQQQPQQSSSSSVSHQSDTRLEHDEATSELDSSNLADSSQLIYGEDDPFDALDDPQPPKPSSMVDLRRAAILSATEASSNAISKQQRAPCSSSTESEAADDGDSSIGDDHTGSDGVIEAPTEDDYDEDEEEEEDPFDSLVLPPGSSGTLTDSNRLVIVPTTTSSSSLSNETTKIAAPSAQRTSKPPIVLHRQSPLANVSNVPRRPLPPAADSPPPPSPPVCSTTGRSASTTTTSPLAPSVPWAPSLRAKSVSPVPSHRMAASVDDSVSVSFASNVERPLLSRSDPKIDFLVRNRTSPQHEGTIMSSMDDAGGEAFSGDAPVPCKSSSPAASSIFTTTPSSRRARNIINSNKNNNNNKNNASIAGVPTRQATPPRTTATATTLRQRVLQRSQPLVSLRSSRSIIRKATTQHSHPSPLARTRSGSSLFARVNLEEPEQSCSIMQYDAFVTAPSPFEAVRRVAAISLKFHTLAGGRVCILSPLSEIELQEGGTYCRVRVKWALPIHNFAIQTSDGNDIAFWYVRIGVAKTHTHTHTRYRGICTTQRGVQFQPFMDSVVMLLLLMER